MGVVRGAVESVVAGVVLGCFGIVDFFFCHVHCMYTLATDTAAFLSNFFFQN